MRVVDTYARKAGTEMLSLIFLSFRMVLVAFIALACVSCSLFPKKELSGTAEERPKVAQGIIASLNSFNASLESLYTSISRGLDESVLSKLDQFIVDGSQKSQVATEQVAYIKIGLDILVDLRAARVPSAEFEHALDSLRTTLVLFNLQTLQYIQIVGRTQLPSGASLTDALSSSENTLALSLSTVADIARRAGIDAKNDVSFEVSELVKKKVSAFEQLLSKMKPGTFLYLQPYLASALKIEKPFGESMGIEAQQLFALTIAENGLLLAGALQAQRDVGQIDNNSYINTLKLWSVEIQSKSEIAANSGVIPVLGSIPDKAPSLIEGTGGLPEGNEGWEFVLVEEPTMGSVDLSKNPPEYTPTETLGFSIDRYGFRACLKIIPAFCTSSFSVVVQTPVKPWTINIKTSQGVPTQFRRGDTIVCSAELQSATQTPIFRWTLIRTEPSFSAEVTQWQVQPGQLSVPNSITPGGSELDVREGDKITCEVAARDSLGLQSPYSAPSLATMYAVNSAASDIYLAQNNAAFDENIVDRLGDAIPTITDSIDLIVDDLDPNSDPFLEIVDCDGQGVVDCPFVVEQHADNIPNQSGRYTARIKRRASKILNYELKSFYDLLFKVVDGNEQLLKTLRLNVSDRNELVTDVTPAQITIAEGSNVEEKLSTIDVDCELESQCQASGYTYAFAQEDCPACAYFEITGENNRFLKNKINLDYEDLFATVEADSRYGTVDAAERVVTLNVKMIVTENTSESEYNHGEFQRTISVIVEDTNEKPTKISFSRSLEIPLGGDDFSLNENTPNTTVLGELSIEDPDLEENPDAVMYTMTLVSPGISGKEILKISGRKIEIGSDTNFEEFEEFADSGVVELTYLITAQDERGETYSESFIFKLMDVNEQPTNVYFSGPGDPSSRFIQGSKSDDRTVVSPNATLSLEGDDPDGDSLSFEIVKVKGVPFDPSSADHPFEIIGSSIRPTRPLNYSEPLDRHWTIEVRARDPGLFESEVQLLDINLIEITPTDIDISENIEPQAIGRFCVNVELDESNPNCIGWVFSISPVPGMNEQLQFDLDGNALLSLSEFDFEEFSSREILVRAENTSDANIFIERVFTINVIDVNEAPTDITFTPITPSQNLQDSGLYILAGMSNGQPVGWLDLIDPDTNEEVEWRLSTNSALSPQGSQFTIVPDNANPKRALLKTFCSPADCLLETPANQEFKIRVLADDKGLLPYRDPAESSPGKQFVFRVVNYPELTLQTQPSELNGDVASGSLQFDVRIEDDTNTAVCTKATGDSVGVHVVNGASPIHAVISESGISISEKESGSGYKDCTVSVVPNENAAGVANVELQVKSSTSVGVIASQASLTVPLTFWRQPELRCPERISLPVGESLSAVQCDVHFSDESAPADRSSESVTVSGCGGLSLNNGELSGSMGTDECSATFTVSGVLNKFGVDVSPSEKTANLIPRRFGTNGLVRVAARNSSTGDVVLGGDFTAVDPIPAPGVTAVQTGNAQRASECNFTEGFDGVVRKVVHDSSNDSFLIGGDFTHYRGQEAKRIVRLYCSGEPASWFFNKGFDGPVYDILIAQDGSVVVGGAFDKYGNTTSKGVVRLSPNGIIKTAYTQLERTSSGEGVFALAEADTEQASLWVGGDFTSYNSDTSFENLVRINLDSGVNELTSSPLISQPVHALAVTTGGVYVGGEFSAPAQRLVRLSNDGSKNDDFDAGMEFIDTPVNSLVLSESSLFVGALTKLVKLNAANGSRVTGFGSSGVVSFEHSNLEVIPSVYTVVTDDSSVYVGGRFTSVNSATAHNFVKLAIGNGAVDGDFDVAVGVNDAVRSLSLFSSDSRLALVGEFSALGGTPAGRLAAFSTSGVFNSNLNGSLGSGFNGAVRALQWSGNDLYVGGAFTEINSNSSRPYLVRLENPLSADGTTTVVDGVFDTSTSGGSLNGEVRALALAPNNSGDHLFVGGAFSQYKGATHKALVLLDSLGALDTSFNVGDGFGVSQPVVNSLSVTTWDEINLEYSVFAGGQFGRYRLTSSPNLVKIKHTGERDGDFVIGTGFNGPVSTTALSGSQLFVGGEFTEFKGTASNLVALNVTNASLVASQNLGGSVRSVVVANSEVWAGGSFFREQSSLARFNGTLELLGSSPVKGKVLLGAHALGEFHSSGVLNSVVSGIHSLLPVTETVNESSTLRLFVTGFFSLLNDLSGNNSVRVESSGTEAVVNPDPP